MWAFHFQEPNNYIYLYVCLLSFEPLHPFFPPPPTPSMKVKVAQLCPTLCGPMDCSPPGSSVHGILQTRTLEWVAMPSSRGSSWPWDWPQVSSTAGGFFTVWATREAPYPWQLSICSLYLWAWVLFFFNTPHISEIIQHLSFSVFHI